MPSADAEILQEKLNAFLRIAKNNEEKQRNFQNYELALLTSNGLFQLLSIILEQHRERFQLSEVSLLLLDPEYEFQRLLDSVSIPKSWQGRLLFTDREQNLTRQFHVPRKVKLSIFNSSQHRNLVPNYSSENGSIAILPLIRQNKLIGSVNLASRQTDRFQPGIGTQFLQHLSAIFSVAIENTRLQESIKQLGLRDPLTGINNRRFFDQRVEEEVSLAKRNKKPLSCLFIDLDHFKQVNDNYGHQAGDLVLQQCAEIFNETMRSTDVLARYGGEEFVILLANTSTKSAFEIAERLRILVEQATFMVDASQSLKVTLSIGMATLDLKNDINTTQNLISSADQAVYSAKQSGRNRVHHAN
jgi:two-component system cell cycle response regulator